jgi:hypothetical protein
VALRLGLQVAGVNRGGDEIASPFLCQLVPLLGTAMPQLWSGIGARPGFPFSQFQAWPLRGSELALNWLCGEEHGVVLELQDGGVPKRGIAGATRRFSSGTAVQ